MGKGGRLIELFTQLDALKEPWLNEVYVFAELHHPVMDSVSMVIFGRGGQGRSALARVGLARHFPEAALVFWPLEQATSLRAHPLDLFQNLENALFRHILRLLQRESAWNQLASWHRGYLAWMAQGLELPPPWEPEAEIWQQLLQEEVSSAWVHTFEQLPWEQRVRPLVDVLQRLEVKQVWVILDISGSKEEDERLRILVATFLQTLAFFEMPLGYKLFLPSSWKDIVHRSSAWQRHRLQTWQLRWSLEDLQHLVAKRLTRVRGRETTLEDLCQDTPWLLSYLQRACGEVPREWILQLRPLVEWWIDQGYQPLSKEQCLALLARYPPRLALDNRLRVVRVGGREIPYGELPDHGLELLEALLARYPGVLSTHEAYRQAYGEVPGEVLRTMQRTLDTLVHRLRQVVEPDPAHPVLILRHRRQGLQLRQMGGADIP